MLARPQSTTPARPLLSPESLVRGYAADISCCFRVRACGVILGPTQLELVRVPRPRDRDRAAEAALALLARPLGVELVGDVGEHDPAGAGAPGVVAGLLRGQVAADPGALRARQGRLDEQQVGLARRIDQLLARAGSRRRR